MMSNFVNPDVERIARIKHKCTYCGESINKGDTYQYQKGNWFGRWFETKMHPECFEDLCESGEGEYTLYGQDRPTLNAGDKS